MENTVQVSYTLTLDEYLKFQKYGQDTPLGRQRKQRRILIEGGLSFILGKLLVMGLVPLMVIETSNLVPLVYAFLYFPYNVIFIFIIIRLFSIWQLRSRRIKNYRSQIDPDGQTVTIAPSGLISENKLRKTEYRWDVVKQPIEKPDLILVPVAKATVIVPRRVFQSEQEANDFINLIVEYRNANKTENPS